MAYYVDSYMEQLYRENKPRFDIDKIQTARDLRNFQSGMYAAYVSCLGGMPEPRPLDARVVYEKRCGAYTRIKIDYVAADGLRAPAYVLVPDKPNGGAVVALAGHGYGVADIVGLTADGREREAGEDPGYHKNFAVEIAKRGFIVAAPELFGFGELTLAPGGKFHNEGSSCYPLTTQLLMYGRTMAGMRVWQAVCMLDYLEEREDVDPERIGSMGISGGGLASSFFAAYDRRVKACVVSGYLCTFRDSIMGMHHCVDNFIPGILNNGEMADLFGLIAPRGLLIEAGTKDDIFPIDGVKSSYARLESLYGRLGARDRLAIDIFDGAHQISGAAAYDFLESRL